MWIIHCTELGAAELGTEHAPDAHHFIVGPFGTDDQAEDTACKLQAEGHVTTDVQAARRAGPGDGGGDVLMSSTEIDQPTVAELEGRLLQIAQRLVPCPIPDFTEGWDLCAHGLPWPCPTTEAAWIARGLDRDAQVHAHQSWVRGEHADAYSGAILETGGTTR